MHPIELNSLVVHSAMQLAISMLALMNVNGFSATLLTVRFQFFMKHVFKNTNDQMGIGRTSPFWCDMDLTCK